MTTRSPRAILAIDLGTTNCKVAVFEGGRPVARASVRVATSMPGPLFSEQDPAGWIAAIEELVRGVVSDSRSIAAIGLSAQSDSLVLADATGRAVRPAMLWMDPRGREEAAELSRRLGVAEVHSLTGLRPAANFTAPKAAWVQRHEPAAHASARWMLQPKDFLFHWLTGEAATDPSSASRTLAFDTRTDLWSDRILGELGLARELMPPVMDDSTVSRPLAEGVARRLGLRPAIPVAVGAADRAAEALGLAIDSTHAMLSTGTATGIAVAIPKDTTANDTRLISPRHAVANERLLLASIPTTGVVLDWFAALGGTPTAAATRRLLHEAAGTSADARGVVASLAFSGSRSIRWRDQDRGVFQGISLSTTRGHFGRAIIESIGLELRAILLVMAEAGHTVDALVLSGGLHRNAFVCQTMSDITGLPAVRYGERDAALAGAMLLASAAIDPEVKGDMRTAARARLGRPRRFAPDPDLEPVYVELAERYERMVADSDSSRASRGA